MSETALNGNGDKRAWWRHLNGYHWFVLGMAIFGWLFDTMDGQIFLASRADAMRSLLPEGENVNEFGGYVTMMFILGWAVGGIFFGMLGDRWGRAKTMGLTILVYAVFTGLSAISRSWWEFGIFRFLTGLGVGGEFAAGASLVAESLPEKARARALGILQAFSAIGNIMGALLYGAVMHYFNMWQYVYLVGAFPAILAVIGFLKLREPEKWLAARNAAKAARASGDKEAKSFGSIGDLFATATLRRNTLVGLMLGIAGVLGLWGVGFFSPELLDASFPVIEEESRPRIGAVIDAPSPQAFQAAVKELTDAERAKYADTRSPRWHGPLLRYEFEAVLAQGLTQEQATQLTSLLAPSVKQALTPEQSAKLPQIVGPQLAEHFMLVLNAAVADPKLWPEGVALSFVAQKPLVGALPSVLAAKVRQRVIAAEACEKPLTAEQAQKVKALFAKAVTAKEMPRLKTWGLVLQQIGAFIGMMMFAWCATRFGRRPAFFFSFLIAWFSVGLTFYAFSEKDQLYYLYPLLGFGTLAPFGGYAMYFPEIFPTRLRNTGTSFCYNVGRFVAAFGPFTLGLLGKHFSGKYEIQGFRLAALVISSAYIIGLLALIWAPETKDQPLPDDEKGLAH